VRFDVTQHPTAAGLSQQVIEAFPWETIPRYLLRDRDASYGWSSANGVFAAKLNAHKKAILATSAASTLLTPTRSYVFNANHFTPGIFIS
jgi:hypothetical protein